MKLIYNKSRAVLLLAVVSMLAASCSDFLDRKPLDTVTPESYFQNADQLGAYAITYYNDLFTSPSGWSQGQIINGDAGTDNMVSGGANQSYFTKDTWTTPNSGDLGFGLIRYCNYFFEQVLPKYEAGFYGTDERAKHYIGEMYFIRAWVYFARLKSYGDYPIVTTVPADRKEELIAIGKRMPRNEVADFILEDLKTAAEMLQSGSVSSKNRINREVALLVRSRVALYEASYERYHRGSGRVPGDTDWPGYSVHPGYTLDVDKHVDELLDIAMKAAKEVADAVTLTENTGVLDQTDPTEAKTGWNPYFEMYATDNLSGYSEVLMWKDYGTVGQTTLSHGVPAYIESGSWNGLLKGYVESFLMANGLPIYAENSGYKGDVTLDNVKDSRDGRLQLFVFGEENWLPFKSTDGVNANAKKFLPVLVPATKESLGDMTGYRIRKGESFDRTQNVFGKNLSTTGQILFRGVEAYLNYIEASYMKNNNIDGDADKYWKAIRRRAKVDEDYNNTIFKTDVKKEAAGDWGAYSKNSLVDETLYNIRRERRCEFIGEGMRWDDLIRWCSMDQMVTEKFIPMGCNFWSGMHKIAIYTEMGRDPDKNIIEFKQYPAPDANISSSSDEFAQGKYILPYRINKNNFAFDGYTWAEAHYNSPFPIRQLQLLSPTEEVSNSVAYQTWGWSTEPNKPALK